MKKTVNRVICIVLSVVLLAGVGFGTVSANDAAAEQPTRVSVCVNGDTASSRGFCWYTTANTATEIIIKNSADEVVNSQLSISEPTVLEWNGRYMHKLTVSGLTAGETYSYSVGGDNAWAHGVFTTDNNDAVTRFINIADIQASNLENFQKGAATLNAALEVMPDADFVSNCGDLTNDSTNEEWDFYDTAFSAINRRITFVPVAGNHDGLGVYDWFNNMFNLDTSESVQTKNGVNYSFDYGNAHFAVLNTNDMLSMSLAQLKWLENDMNSTDKDWKIVFMHKSPYTLGKDGKWPDALYLQSSLARVLDKCNVDIAFSGHDHMYLRTKQLTGNKVANGGVTYVLSGTAGTKRYEVREFLEGHFLEKDFIAAMTIQKHGYGNTWNGRDWNTTDEANVGGCFSAIEIDGTTLRLNAYILGDSTGETKLVDTLVLNKRSGENKITYTGENTTSAAEYILGVVPSFLSLAVYTFGSWLPKFLWMLPELIAVYIKDGTF